MDCYKCGQCCISASITFEGDFLINDDEEIRFLSLHGIEIDQNGRLTILTFHRNCDWLTNENLCKHYESRPRKCRDYECRGGEE